MGNTNETNAQPQQQRRGTRTQSSRGAVGEISKRQNMDSRNRGMSVSRSSNAFNQEKTIKKMNSKVHKKAYNEIILQPSFQSIHGQHGPKRTASNKGKREIFQIVLTPQNSNFKGEKSSIRNGTSNYSQADREKRYWTGRDIQLDQVEQNQKRLTQKKDHASYKRIYNEIILTPADSEPQINNSVCEIALVTSKKQSSKSSGRDQCSSISIPQINGLGNRRQSLQISLDPETHPMKHKIKEAMSMVDRNEVPSIKIDSFDLAITKDSDFIVKNNNQKIQWQDFFILNFLGKGQLGEVFVAQQREKICDKESLTYAIKRIKKININVKKLKENIRIQNECLKNPHARNNFITRIHYSFQNEQYFYLAMDYAKGGNISSFLKRQNERAQIFEQNGQETIRFILACTILGLEYLHSKNIVYQDLKPQNLLVFENGYIKLSDFGLTRQKKQSHYYMKAESLCYYAPEMVYGIQCQKYVDFWALGVLAYQLTNFTLPFGIDDLIDSDKFIGKATESTTQRKWENSEVSQELKDFINKLLVLQPNDRLGSNGWNQIKQHNFFKSKTFDWRFIQSQKIASPLLEVIRQQMEKKQIYLNYLNVVDTGRNLYTIQQMFSNTISQNVSTPKFKPPGQFF